MISHMSLIAKELVEVRPLSPPSGVIYYYDYKFISREIYGGNRGIHIILEDELS